MRTPNPLNGPVIVRWLALMAVGMLAAANAFAQPVPAERRVALVIGNSSYQNVARLGNPGRDAAAVSAALRASGFDRVTTANDLTRDRLISAMGDFAREADSADWAVVYFAGHGIEVGGVNYMIPVDARLETDRDVEFQAVDLNKVLTAVDRARKLRIVILDACRDNPFLSQMKRSVASRSIGRGLGQVEPDTGTLVVYAAKHGQLAIDGDGANSPFTSAFIKRMQMPGLEVRRLFDLVRDDVMRDTNRKQQPFTYGSVSGSEDFYFRRAAATIPSQAQNDCERLVDPQASRAALRSADVDAALQACSSAVEGSPADPRLRTLLQAALDQRAYRKAVDSRDRAMSDAYLALFPGGRFVAEVRQHLAGLASPPTPAPPPSPTPDPAPAYDSRELARRLQIELARVGCEPGGTDGRWGPSSQQAMELYNRGASTRHAVTAPSMEALADMRTRPSRVCVAALPSPPSPQPSLPQPPPSLPQPPPPPAQSRGSCFAFNGRQYCE